MIKAEINSTGKCSLELEGEPTVVMAESIALINKIYNAFVSVSPKAAKTFRNGLTILALDPESPLFMDNDELGRFFDEHK